MTTNVFDKSAAVLASDTRWSYRLVQDGPIKSTVALLYVDDTGFEKIEFQPDYSYIFAGPSDLIDRWKKWINSPTRSVVPSPGYANDFALCIIDMSTGDVFDEHGQRIRDAMYRFAGTGAEPAHNCWKQFKDPRKAVRSATDGDIYSGGEVKYLNLTDSTNNLDTSGTIESIKQSTLKRGMVMYTSGNNAPMPIDEAAANDPRIKDLVTKIAKGEAIAEAPCGLDTVVWTDTDVSRLNASLHRMYGTPAK
jgi:hypothetical protein